MNNNLKSEIEEIIKNLMVSHDDDDDKVKETVGEYFKYIDSIGFVELITAVESKYDIEICNEDLIIDNIKELDTFMLMIEKYIK